MSYAALQYKFHKCHLLIFDVRSTPAVVILCYVHFNVGSLSLAPNLKDLMHLQVSDWNRLGLALKLNSYDLNIIEQDNRGDTRKQTLKMFEHWLKTQPDASYEQLIKALREVGDETVVNSLSIKHGKRIASSRACSIS